MTFLINLDANFAEESAPSVPFKGPIRIAQPPPEVIKRSTSSFDQNSSAITRQLQHVNLSQE
jgi:hypothetical protein